MPRIRTIKPEFCTNDQVAECSPTARLLFILLWMFCDDGGVHPASLKRVKMECFPADSFELDQIRTWITELLNAGLLMSYIVGGKEFWKVTGWHHQKIDKPNFRWPQPKFDDHSTTSRRPFDDHSSTIRRTGATEDRRGKESNKKEFAERSSNTRRPFDDYSSNFSPNPPDGPEAVVRAFHRLVDQSDHVPDRRELSKAANVCRIHGVDCVLDLLPGAVKRMRGAWDGKQIEWRFGHVEKKIADEAYERNRKREELERKTLEQAERRKQAISPRPQLDDKTRSELEAMQQKLKEKKHGYNPDA